MPCSTEVPPSNDIRTVLCSVIQHSLHSVTGFCDWTPQFLEAASCFRGSPRTIYTYSYESTPNALSAHVSKSLRDRIVRPTITTSPLFKLRTRNTRRLTTGLLSTLNRDVLILCLHYLSVQDLLKTTQCSTFLYSAATENRVWLAITGLSRSAYFHRGSLFVDSLNAAKDRVDAYTKQLKGKQFTHYVFTYPVESYRMCSVLCHLCSHTNCPYTGQLPVEGDVFLPSRMGNIVSLCLAKFRNSPLMLPPIQMAEFDARERYRMELRVRLSAVQYQKTGPTDPAFKLSSHIVSRMTPSLRLSVLSKGLQLSWTPPAIGYQVLDEYEVSWYLADSKLKKQHATGFSPHASSGILSDLPVGEAIAISFYGVTVQGFCTPTVERLIYMPIPVSVSSLSIDLPSLTPAYLTFLAKIASSTIFLTLSQKPDPLPMMLRALRFLDLNVDLLNGKEENVLVAPFDILIGLHLICLDPSLFARQSVLVCGRILPFSFSALLAKSLGPQPTNVDVSKALWKEKFGTDLFDPLEGDKPYPSVLSFVPSFATSLESFATNVGFLQSILDLCTYVTSGHDRYTETFLSTTLLSDAQDYLAYLQTAGANHLNDTLRGPALNHSHDRKKQTPPPQLDILLHLHLLHPYHFSVDCHRLANAPLSHCPEYRI